MTWREMVARDFIELDKSYKSGDLARVLASMKRVFEDIRLDLINLREDTDTLDCDLDDRIRATVEDIVEEKIRQVLEDAAWRRAQG